MKTSTSHTSYVVDDEDPRAPSQDEWDRMTEAERRRVVDALPSELPVSEAMPPEGDLHHDATDAIRDTLRGYFRRRGAGIYIGSNLGVYYPGERVFAPDIMAVTGVSPHPRQRWVVSDEGKGLELALEIHHLGNAPKDLRTNVARYARLGIAEYFVFDARRMKLLGYRLPAGGPGTYTPIAPAGVMLRSDVLDLELALVGGRVRFYQAGAMLPDREELIDRLDGIVDELMDRAEEEARRAEEEARRAEEEARRADLAEQRLAEALAELRRLKGE